MEQESGNTDSRFPKNLTSYICVIKSLILSGPQVPYLLKVKGEPDADHSDYDDMMTTIIIPPTYFISYEMCSYF